MGAGRRRLGRGPSGLEPCGRSASRWRGGRPGGAGRGGDARLRLRPRAAGGAAGDRPRGDSRWVLSTTPSCCAPPTWRASRSTTERRRARVGAGVLWNDARGPGRRARAGGAARPLRHGRDHGLHRRRRAGLAGTQPRPGLQRRHRVRGRDGRRAPGARGRRDRARPVLGAARRGRRGGVVTALEFELFPLQEAFAGHIAWPLERAGEVVEAYRSWTSDLPEELTSTIRLIALPAACPSCRPSCAARRSR